MVLICHLCLNRLIVVRALGLPDIRACDILIGKCPLIPNILPEKRLEAPLTRATLARVPVKNWLMQPDTSTFTITVVTMNTTKITNKEDRIRTSGDSLEETKGREQEKCY